MSQLATRDHNLFGMKWASSYASAAEVAGKASWGYRGGRYALHLQLLDMGKREDAPLLHDRKRSLISHPEIVARSIRILRTG